MEARGFKFDFRGLEFEVKWRRKDENNVEWKARSWKVEGSSRGMIDDFPATDLPINGHESEQEIQELIKNRIKSMGGVAY